MVESNTAPAPVSILALNVAGLPAPTPVVAYRGDADFSCHLPRELHGGTDEGRLYIRLAVDEYAHEVHLETACGSSDVEQLTAAINALTAARDRLDRLYTADRATR